MKQEILKTNEKKMSEIINEIADVLNDKGFCSGNDDAFPCGEEAIVLVSMGLAAAGLGLIMVAFLMHQVRLSFAIGFVQEKIFWLIVAH